MAFSPLKIGGWAFGEILTSAQMNQLNNDFPFALDGRSGGSYAPSNDLNVQTSTSKKVVLNGLTCLSAADGGHMSCIGSIAAAVDVSCSTATVGALSATTADLSSLHVANSTVLGSVPGTDLVTINARTTANARLRSPRGMQQGGDAGVVYQYTFSSYDIVYIPLGHSVSASTRWRIGSGNVPIVSGGNNSGEVISFRHLGNGSSIEIQDPAGATITFIGPVSAGHLIQVDIAYNVLSAAYVVIGMIFS